MTLNFWKRSRKNIVVYNTDVTMMIANERS